MIFFFNMLNGFIKVLLPLICCRNDPATLYRNGSVSDCRQQEEFWRKLLTSLHPAHSIEPSKYGRKGHFCTVKRGIQEANAGKFAGGKVISK